MRSCLCGVGIEGVPLAEGFACGIEGVPLASVHVLVVEESSLPRITVSRVEIVRLQFGAWY